MPEAKVERGSTTGRPVDFLRTSYAGFPAGLDKMLTRRNVTGGERPWVVPAGCDRDS